MSDAAVAVQRQQARQQGFLAGLVTLPFRLLGVLFGALFMSIVIECIGMHFFWPEQGWHHARSMLENEVALVSDSFTRSVFVQEPGRTAKQVAERAYDTLFVQSGLLGWMQDAASQSRTPATGEAHDFRYYMAVIYTQVEAYLVATIYTVLVFLVRLLVLTLMLPMLLLAAFVGLVDGLVRRDVRSFGAGRESGFIYHRAKASLMPLAVLPWVIYLALPASVHPLAILLPGAVMLGVATDIAAGSFKKYL